jgi:hypothetical protein
MNNLFRIISIAVILLPVLVYGNKSNQNDKLMENDNSVPQVFELKQNYPNPFNPATVISFSIPNISTVTLKIYSITGKEITTLINEEKRPGEYSVYFDASLYGLSSGVYFYQLTAGTYSATKKFTLLK